MKALVLSLVTALGIGSVYLAQEPAIIIQKEEGVASLEKARRSTFLITLTDYHVSGSAVLVGRKKLDDGGYRYTALTAHHVVSDMAKKFAEDKTTASHTIEMMFQPDFHGKPFRITVDIDDIEWALPSHDWAAIMFEMESKISCAEVATEEEFKAIKPFEKIYAVGCGGLYGQHCREGIIGSTHNEYHNPKMVHKNSAVWNRYPEKFFRPYINGWYGDSGGGVFNKEGKLIGIINGASIMASYNIPVTHSMTCLKTYLILDITYEGFFLVED